MFQVNYNTFLPTWTQPNLGGFSPHPDPAIDIPASKMRRGTFRRTMRKRLPPNDPGCPGCHMASLEVIEVLILQDWFGIFVKKNNISFIQFIQNRIETQRSVVFIFNRFYVCILELRLFKASTQLTQAKSIFAIFQVANSKSFVPQPAARQWFLRRNHSNKAPKSEKTVSRSRSSPWVLQVLLVFLCVCLLWKPPQALPEKTTNAFTNPYNSPVKNCPPELVCW